MCQGRSVVRIGRWFADALLVVAVASSWGCGLVSRHFPKMQNPAPVVRARAIGQDDRRPNVQVVPALIGRLEDSDPVIRLAAHEELRRRTGRDFGFVPWANLEDRAAAIKRWRDWLAGPPMPAEPVSHSTFPSSPGRSLAPRPADSGPLAIP
jgi:hypothetical protein